MRRWHSSAAKSEEGGRQSRAVKMSHTCHWAAAGSHNGGGSVKAGKKGTIHVSAKAMNMTWANDARFWKWIPLSKNEQPKAFSKDDMSFDAAAELIQVNWLEARGSLDSAEHKKQPRLSGSGRYEIIYHLRFKVDAFGWNNAPVTFELITPDGHRQQKSVMLEPYRRRSNEWQEIHGGELKMTGKVEFAMFQVDSHGWKGGIIFGGVSLRPK